LRAKPGPAKAEVAPIRIKAINSRRIIVVVYALKRNEKVWRFSVWSILYVLVWSHWCDLFDKIEGGDVNSSTQRATISGTSTQYGSSRCWLI
jgi:hypothetical protein